MNQRPNVSSMAQFEAELALDNEEVEDLDELDEQEKARQEARAKGEPPLPMDDRFSDVVSGQFDADETDEQLAPPKRILLPQADTPKLHKVLAQSGLGSRLEMEQLIMQGRISVNNEPAHIGQRIQFGDHVKVNGKPLKLRIAPPPARVIAYHKPAGEVVTNDDPQNRPTVFRKLPRLAQGKWQSVGRLDLNTEGLLLFTSSGELANKLMHPRFGLEREYAVRVLGALSDEERQRLLDGVQLDDGPAQFGSITDGGGDGANHWYRVTINEGRNREVRRMFDTLGHAVSRLIRIRYGAMVLPRGLKRGVWMELGERDIQMLMQAAGVERKRPAPEQQPRPERKAEQAKQRNDRGRRRRGGAGPRPNGGPNPGAQGPGQGQAQAPLEQQPPRNYVPGESMAGQKRRGGGGKRGPGPGGPQGGGGGGGQGGGQPDPMKTSFGYIGADSFFKQRNAGGPRRGGGQGGGGGGGGQPRSGRGGGGRGR